MLLSLREHIEVPSGRAGNRVLMALTARPARRGDNSRVLEAIDVIEQYSAYAHYRQTGKEEVGNPRKGKRSLKYTQNRLSRVFSEFQQAVKAGRTFISSLAARDEAALERGYAEVLLPIGRRFPVRVPALPHVEALRQVVSQSGPVYVRQQHWENFIPTIHIGGAFAELYDWNVALQGSIDWQEFCRSLLFREENAEVATIIVRNANRLLQAAEDCSFFPKANPSPLMLVG